MTTSSRDDGLRGTSRTRVRTAVESGEPLCGTSGFVAEVDGSLVTDVLGRRPAFLGRDEDGWTWDRSPAAFDDAVWVPPGSALPLAALDGPETDPREAARRIWTLPDPEPNASRVEAVSAVDRALESTGVPPECPVAFSGGVDSAVVATMSRGPLYAAGFPGSGDVRRAREAAAAMGRTSDLTVVELDEERLESAIPAVARATGRTNAMDVAIAAPLWVVARRVVADGYDVLAVGQAVDELFGGYEKVERAPSDSRVEADTVRGAVRETIRTVPDQFARDVPALRAGGVTPVAPLVHDHVVRAALELPGELLVSGRGERKFGFRLAARRRVPDGVAFRGKTAIQYGTRVARELDRMARQAGFQRSGGNHVRRYVESLVGSE